jgi:WD40 repeat protein
MWRELSLFGCAQSHTSALAACPCSDGTVHVLTLQPGSLKPLHCLNAASDIDATAMCIGATFSPDDRELAVVMSNGVILGYTVDTWQPLFQVQAGPDSVAPLWALKVRHFPGQQHQLSSD